MRQRGPLLPIFDVPGRRGAVNFANIVGEPTPYPVAHFTYTADDLEVTFDASTSTTPPGTTITDYDWDFGDGDTSTTGPVVIHTYDAPPTYTVALILTNSIPLVSPPYSQDVPVNVVPRWFVTRTLWDLPTPIPDDDDQRFYGYAIDDDEDGFCWAISHHQGLVCFEEADPSNIVGYWPDIGGEGICCVGDWLVIAESFFTGPNGPYYNIVRRSRADPEDSPVTVISAIVFGTVTRFIQSRVSQLSTDKVVFAASGYSFFGSFSWIYQYTPSTNTLVQIQSGAADQGSAAFLARSDDSRVGTWVIVHRNDGSGPRWWMTETDFSTEEDLTVFGPDSTPLTYEAPWPRTWLLRTFAAGEPSVSYSYDIDAETATPWVGDGNQRKWLWHPTYEVTYYGPVTAPAGVVSEGGLPGLTVINDAIGTIDGYATHSPPPASTLFVPTIPGNGGSASVLRTTNYFWQFPANDAFVESSPEITQFARWELTENPDWEP